MPFGNRKNIILDNLYSSVLSKFKNYHSSGKLKYSRIFKSLKLRNLNGKILPISLKLNFTPNTSGNYGLRIFQRNGLQLDKDLIFSGLVQNVYVYRMAKSKKI